MVNPIDVFVKVDKINPSIKTVYAGKAHIEHNRQEHHIVTFSVGTDGAVFNVTTDNPVSLHEKTGLGVVTQDVNGQFEEQQGKYWGLENGP